MSFVRYCAMMTLAVLSGCGPADTAQSEPLPPAAARIELTKFPAAPIPRYDYDYVIHPIEGPQSKLFPDWTFNFDNVVVTKSGEVIARITEGACAAFKWEAEKDLWRTQGRYIVEVTLPETRPGVVAAPLWLYSEGASEGGHEFDFELMNGRIEYNMHNGRGGFNMRSVNRDLGGHRVRFEIERRPDLVTMRLESLTDGFTDELVITPEKVKDWSDDRYAPPDFRWPPNDTPMFPVMEFWVSNAPGWVGEWEPLAKGQSVEMVIHGYSFSAI